MSPPSPAAAPGTSGGGKGRDPAVARRQKMGSKRDSNRGGDSATTSNTKDNNGSRSNSYTDKWQHKERSDRGWGVDEPVDGVAERQETQEYLRRQPGMEGVRGGGSAWEGSVVPPHESYRRRAARKTSTISSSLSRVDKRHASIQPGSLAARHQVGPSVDDLSSTVASPSPPAKAVPETGPWRSSTPTLSRSVNSRSVQLKDVGRTTLCRAVGDIILSQEDGGVWLPVVAKTRLFPGTRPFPEHLIGFHMDSYFSEQHQVAHPLFVRLYTLMLHTLPVSMSFLYVPVSGDSSAFDLMLTEIPW